ncbi:unnamed protein product [Somion occarium]|uniref:BTB domain-containing protein n=1 Tax=Somion occarium TaxID=3059160 RepID=A0ABP1D6N8_9APHY
MPSTASHPFDASDADIILRSSGPEPVDFRVYRQILVLSSPVFATMFTLPQSQSAGNEVDIPVVELSEGADILDPLLRFIYPVARPNIQTLDAMTPLLEAASKYDLAVVPGTLRYKLLSTSILEKEPLRVYAIAMRYGFEEEAKIVPPYTLRTKLLHTPLIKELEHISGYAYHRLILMYCKRGSEAARLLDTWNPRCRYDSTACTQWMDDYKRRAREELLVRPAGDSIFISSFIWARHTFCGNTGCELSKGLESLRAQIDVLPDTI